MNFVERILDGFKARMIATFYYSTLPFAAVPEFYDKVTGLVNTDETESDTSNFFAGFMPVVAILGDILLIALGTVSLVFATLAAIAQTIYLPFELMVGSIEDAFSSEDEFIPENLDMQEQQDAEYNEENADEMQNDDDYDNHHEEEIGYNSDEYQQPDHLDQEEQQTENAGYYQSGQDFWGQKVKEHKAKPFYIDPEIAAEFLRKYGGSNS